MWTHDHFHFSEVRDQAFFLHFRRLQRFEVNECCLVHLLLFLLNNSVEKEIYCRVKCKITYYQLPVVRCVAAAGVQCHPNPSVTVIAQIHVHIHDDTGWTKRYASFTSEAGCLTTLVCCLKTGSFTPAPLLQANFWRFNNS